jgi:hypothetical protein
VDDNSQQNETGDLIHAKEIDGANQGQVQLSDTEPIRCSGVKDRVCLVHRFDYKSISLIAVNQSGNTPRLLNHYINV